MKIKIIFFVLFALTSNHFFGQGHPLNETDSLYELNRKLMTGDKNTLLEIAKYFDSQKEIIEFLGYHRMEVTEGEVAKRIVSENCLFTADEISINYHTTAEAFSDFITTNYDEIIFSHLANAFILTPLENREVNAKLREISKTRKAELIEKNVEIQDKEWIKMASIDYLIENKDPKCLLKIASELFKIRYRFNVHHFNQTEYIELLQLLTHTEIAVENEKKEITWHIDKEFYPESSLNMLIYFSKHYTEYKWNEERQLFENPNRKVNSMGKEETLFQLLGNANDERALNAFIQLTTCDVDKVMQLSSEYQRAAIETNDALSIFPYRFLAQLAQLTAYCRKEEIDYNNPTVKTYVGKLKSDLTFNERRKLEDEVIEHLTLEAITSFEYWALIHGDSWGLNYSAGRILDIFYSKHFDEVLDNEKQLKLYLKKSYFFENLGIIGICNNYLVKFTNLQNHGTEKLNAITENEFAEEVAKAKDNCRAIAKLPNDDQKSNVANKDHRIENLRLKIISISQFGNPKLIEDSLTTLLSQISYQQIGEAMEEIETIPFKGSKWKKYSFLERDFGFFMYNDFTKSATINAFLKDYRKYDEWSFYKNMLEMAGTNYLMNNNTLDCDKIFEALKYNVITAFVGGGGGRDDNEVYAIIKMLELTYKTTLGYPKKLCNSDGLYGCNSYERANYWMQYLVDNNLLKLKHDAIVSFHY